MIAVISLLFNLRIILQNLTVNFRGGDIHDSLFTKKELIYRVRGSPQPLWLSTTCNALFGHKWTLGSKQTVTIRSVTIVTTESRSVFQFTIPWQPWEFSRSVFGVVRKSVTISLSRLSQLLKVVRDVKVRNLMTILTVCSTFHDSSRDNWITWRHTWPYMVRERVNILVGVTGKGWSQLRINRWSWNLLGTFYRVKLDCVPKDFVRRRFVRAIFAIRSEMAYSRFSAINFISPQQSNAEQNPLVRTFIIPQTIPLPSYSFNRLNCTLKSSI